MAQKTYKNNIFDVLAALDRGDVGYYCSLSEDSKKDLNPWLLMRWMSATETKNEMHHILMVNELVNVDLSAISKHPELVWKLLCICGTGSKQKHVFIKPPKGSRTAKKGIDGLLEQLNPCMKYDELETLAKVNSEEDIIEYAKGLGVSDEELGKIFK